MAINFPSSPVQGQVYEFGDYVYTFDGVKWTSVLKYGLAAAKVSSETPPPNPEAGLMWYVPSTGESYLWYDDGDSGQWIQENPSIGAVAHRFLEGVNEENSHKASAISIEEGGNVQGKLEELTGLTKGYLIAQRYSGNYGFFAEGFNYGNVGDVGIDSDGGIWKYTGAGAPTKGVAAGTVPSAGAGYEQVTFKKELFGTEFSAGGTVTDSDQLVSDDDGNRWRWTGDLNYVFAAGEDPNNVAGWEKFVNNDGVIQDNRQFNLLGCSIRNTGSGWEFIEDGSHEKIGFSNPITVVNLGSVKVIRVPYSFTGTKATSFSCDVDETLSALGFNAGVSVGTNYLDISITNSMRGSVNFSNGSVSLASHWIGDITSSKAADGSITIVHPNNRGQVPLTSVVSSSSRSVYPPSISFSSTSTVIVPQHPISGYAYWNGSEVSLVTMCNGVTVTESSGVFTVNHVVVNASDMPTVSARSGSIVAQWDNVTGSSFDIKFRDFTGTQISSSMASLRASFSKESLVPANLDYGVVSFDLGVGYVDPEKVTSSSGNIWVYGIIEK